MNILKRLFLNKVNNIPNIKKVPKKKLSDIKQFDDIWLNINGEIYEGWILEIIQNTVNIVFTDSNGKLRETSFNIERPLDRTVLQQNNRMLILNKEEAI